MLPIKPVSNKKYKVAKIFKCVIIIAGFLSLLPNISYSSADIPPHIPEPMVYDLVRSLGAPRGELEINTLLEYSAQRGEIEPNPEIEYSFWDGYAVELEVDTLVSTTDSSQATPIIADYKPSLQGTFGYGQHFIHGWQFTGEYYTDQIFNRGAGYSNTALYLVGYRFNKRWSTFNMAGVRRTAFNDSKSRFKGIFNSAIFYNLSHRVVLGIETNWVYRPNLPDNILIVPQVHLGLTEHITLQLGAGVQRTMNHNFGYSAMRFVFTF
ncbi:hypothetical conserved protein [Candidatus Nitrosoglobus terrae]|uniref:Hypothetical conserved protein n=1 Tax=Candidatus Nitrosoglobus terrae TaxID=1630141 RepID=A0A1Q2SKM2_9GAMM|nr:hypothetical protein [Candidatus Nitrosoglobus terrae]BAW79652.1 hypothetical conserved protein [Candidatus Nitrosoglobus terrae]